MMMAICQLVFWRVKASVFWIVNPGPSVTGYLAELSCAVLSLTFFAPSDKNAYTSSGYLENLSWFMGNLAR